MLSRLITPLPPASRRLAKRPGALSLFTQLGTSSMFTTYAAAFSDATNLPLWLEPPEGPAAAPPGRGTALNSFCTQVNSGHSTCQACLEAHGTLLARAAEKTAATQICFAGFRETAVPVWLGREVFALLRTGQVLEHAPVAADFAPIERMLRADPELREPQIAALRSAYLESPSMSGQQYEGVLQLLTFFAAQLSAHVERLARAVNEEWPEPVRRVAAHLRTKFDEATPLATLARIATLSPGHLCTVFKESTGLTLTEYLNRERILQARQRLTSRHARVSEVALDVGFGSLSQFNRCFQRYAGESPTSFRARVLHQQPSRASRSSGAAA